MMSDDVRTYPEDTRTEEEVALDLWRGIISAAVIVVTIAAVVAAVIWYLRRS